MEDIQNKRKLMDQINKLEQDLSDVRDTVNRMSSPNLDNIEEHMEKMENALTNMRSELSDVIQDL